MDGNPHIHTDPLNGMIIARNILQGLQRVSPENSAYFAQREQDFEKRVLEATMGADLVRHPHPGHRLRSAAKRQAARISSASRSIRVSPY